MILFPPYLGSMILYLARNCIRFVSPYLGKKKGALAGTLMGLCCHVVPGVWGVSSNGAVARLPSAPHQPQTAVLFPSVPLHMFKRVIKRTLPCLHEGGVELGDGLCLCDVRLCA